MKYELPKSLQEPLFTSNQKHSIEISCINLHPCVNEPSYLSFSCVLYLAIQQQPFSIQDA